MSVWVVNASPLILLGKIARLSLLAELSERVVIPHEVALEIEAGPVTDPARQWLAVEGRRFAAPPDAFDLRVVAWDLGAGETAVISRAYGPSQTHGLESPCHVAGAFQPMSGRPRIAGRV